MKKNLWIILLTTIVSLTAISVYVSALVDGKILVTADWVISENEASRAAPGAKPEHTKFAVHAAGNIYRGNPRVDLKGPLNEGFEGGAIPADWRVRNQDLDTYQWEAYSTAEAHSGSYVARVHYNGSGCDDWLIPPRLSVVAGDSLKFWAKSYSATYLEDFEVRLSTTGHAAVDFTTQLDAITDTPYDWTEYRYDLGVYAGQEIYVAVRCVSVDEYYLYLDDFTGPEVWVPAGKVIAFNTTSIPFGTVPLGGSKAIDLKIYSIGAENVTVSGFASDNGHFTHNFPGSTAIPPGDSLAVTVTFAPTAYPEETGTLTVTHDGTKADTTIAVSGSGIDALFYEDFATGIFPPPGWAKYQDQWPPGWLKGSPGHGDTYCAYHGDNALAEDYLVTPQISIPAGKATYELEFVQYEWQLSWYEGHAVLVSTDSGDPDDDDFVLLQEVYPGTQLEWEAVENISLAAYAGQDIYLAFYYYGDYADEWSVDDIIIQEFTYVNQPPDITHDPKGDTDDVTPTITAIIADGDGVSSAKVFYETAPKAYSQADMSLTGVLANEYSVDLPSLPYGTINYYIQAEDDSGAAGTDPPGAPTEHYSFEIQPFAGTELSYDDSTKENAWTWTEFDSTMAGRWAVRFTPQAYPCTLKSIKVGVDPDFPDPAHQPFAVEIYDDDGPAGEPGTMIYGPDTTGSIGNVVGGVAALSEPIWAYACIHPPVVIEEGDVYAAVGAVTLAPFAEAWDIDEDGIHHRRSWVHVADEGWYQWESYQGFPANLMIRAYLVTGPPPQMYLSGGQVDPIIGSLGATFAYSVSYIQQADVPPTIKDVYVDGVPHAMTDPTGGAGPYSGGVVFTYQHQFANTGDHEFYFYFEDGALSDREPYAGTWWGPMNGYYNWDFESAGVFTPTGPQDDWEWGVPAFANGPSAHSGQKCWGTILNGNHTDLSRSRLETPHLDFTMGGSTKLELKFWHWYDTEKIIFLGQTTYDDGGNVKVITPTDTTIIHPDTSQAEDYDAASMSTGNAWIPSQPGYCEHRASWMEAIFDLTPWTNESDVVIVFDFGSDNGGIDWPGWYIDDVVIWGDLPLPVELAGFTATAGDGMVTLDWATGSELNNRGFEIYRRVESREFVRINGDIIPGAGTSATGHDYTYVDRGLINGVTYYYRLADVDLYGHVHLHDAIVSAIPASTLPQSFALMQNYPNPFNPDTRIRYHLAKDVAVKLSIYNVSGQQVITLVDRDQSAGYYQVEWRGTDGRGGELASGVYFYRLEAGERVFTRKMVLLK